MHIIYISGIDGCGKTTQARLLVNWFHKNNFSAEYQWLRWEPSVRYLIDRVHRAINIRVPSEGEDIRRVDIEEYQNQRWTSFKRSLLTFKLIQKVWLGYATRDYFRSYQKAHSGWTSEYVVLDRYLLDFVIDQSINLGVSPDSLSRSIKSSVLKNMQLPQFSILIDLPAKLGYQRKLDGTSMNYLQKRQSLYESIDADGNVLHIDGTQSIDAIHQHIIDWLSERIGNRK